MPTNPQNRVPFEIEGPQDGLQQRQTIYQPSLAEQLRQIAVRLPGLNQYNRDRLNDVAAAMARKETALDDFMCRGWSGRDY